MKERQEPEDSDGTGSYAGLFGLDTLDVNIKFINSVVTIAIGIKLSFSWHNYLFGGGPAYQLFPCGWPLLLLFAWPVCAVILWLRVTGVSWSGSVLAGLIVTVISISGQLIFDAIYWWLG